MRRALLFAAIISFGTVFLDQTAQAQVTYSDGQIHTISTVQSSGTFTLTNDSTLDVGAGGSITGGSSASPDGVDATSGTVNVNGGTVNGFVDSTGNTGTSYGIYAPGTSAVTVNSGSITGGNGKSYGEAIGGDLGALGTLNVCGGTITGGVGAGGTWAIHNLVVNMYGGVVSGGIWNGGGNSPMNLYGGTETGQILNGGAINIAGVTVTGSASPLVESLLGNITIQSGNVGGDVWQLYGGTGEIVVTGGTVSGNVAALAGPLDVYAGCDIKKQVRGGGATTVHGGKIEGGIYTTAGTMNVYGGKSSATSMGIEAMGGTTNIYGSGFDYPSGQMTAASGTLTGKLANGDSINTTFFVAGAGKVILHTLIPGDVNSDGLVDVADYNIWAANVGKTDAGWSQGDLNGDGLVDVADYNIWAANVGKTAGTPEPATLALVVFGVSGILGRRK
jgi:hypothetical protein